MNRTIEEVRKAKGFTQEQVAKGVGIGASTYCQYETGLRGVPAEVANKIARFLDVEVGDIFCRRSSQLANIEDEREEEHT